MTSLLLTLGEVERSPRPMAWGASTIRHDRRLEAISRPPRRVRCGCRRCGAHTYAARQTIGMSRVCTVCGSPDVAPVDAPALEESGGRNRRVEVSAA